MTDQEDEMRAIDCPCGHHFERAADAHAVETLA
jgi:hypothetical protein